MRTRKGPKLENTTRPPADIRKKRNWSRELNRSGKSQVEETTKRIPNTANCLEKAVKRKPQAEKRKTEQKLFQKPTERKAAGTGMEETKAPQHQQNVPGTGQPANH